MSHNLLPNASFEFDFGQPVATNWADVTNRLTLRFTATGQTPAVAPKIVADAAAPDGQYVAQVALETTDRGAEGHLTSPVVEVIPCQVYTLSAWARSDAPGARLYFGMWTVPADRARTPNILSAGQLLSDSWQRYTFTFALQELESQGVVDLMVTADAPGRAWFDAVQLEIGPAATEFRPRYGVEARLAGHDAPRLTHLADRPLEFELTTYNNGEDASLTIVIDDLLRGEHRLTHAVAGPVPPGRHEQVVSIDFSLLGEFRARVFAGDEQVGVDEYLFVVHPVMADDFQGVLRSRRGVVDQVPADRIWLPWNNQVNWYAESPANLTVTKDDKIHVMTADHTTLMETPDGGRTWSAHQMSKYVMAVLRDGTYLNASHEGDDLVVYRSTDEGKTWQRGGVIPDTAAGVQAGAVTELKDGTLIWPIGRMAYNTIGGPGGMVYAYRSPDGGMTWSEPSPMTPGGEPQIAELDGGRLLGVCRNNPRIPVEDWTRAFKNEKAWRLWARITTQSFASYTKRVTLVDSEDGGITWVNPRPGSFLLDEMHGEALQLPDGRVVLFYTHRCPWVHGGERAKVSRDGGQTWGEEIYYMNSAPAYPGYSACCLLPPHLADGKPGMILTVVGERSEKNWGSEGQATSEGIKHMPRMAAVRWRPA